MADLKPLYLVHGDDDARIDAWRSRVRKRADNPRDEQMVEGAIEQRERGAFPPAGERGSLDQLLPAFDVRGRQRAQRARHLGKRQIAEMFRFERGEPRDETIAWRGQMDKAGPTTPPRHILHAGGRDHLHRFHAKVVQVEVALERGLRFVLGVVGCGRA